MSSSNNDDDQYIIDLEYYMTITQGRFEELE
jgi:hypothetical protein